VDFVTRIFVMHWLRAPNRGRILQLVDKYSRGIRMAAEEKKAGEQQKSKGATGPLDIPREPGKDRPLTADELPVGEQARPYDVERPSRSGGHDVNADRRRSRGPYSGVERRAH
jgi:hypothetical protein